MPAWFIKSFNIFFTWFYSSTIKLEAGKFKDLDKSRKSVFFLVLGTHFIKKTFCSSGIQIRLSSLI